MSEYDISFSSSSSAEVGSFKLLELPKDLCNILESAIRDADPLSLKVKGQPNEDAVLCTDDKTFTLRSVLLSNSVLVVTSPLDASFSYSESSNDQIVIRGQVNEIMEITPSVPKLHKLMTLLRGVEYDEGQEDNDLHEHQGKRLIYEEARAVIQASDSELDRALKDKHILNINGELRPIAPSYLSVLLELILNLLVSLSLPCDRASVDELSSALADEHEVAREVSTQLMSWFGTIVEGKWNMDIKAVLKEIGLSILRHCKDTPVYKDELLAKWKKIVGDTFESSVSVDLLSGYYLASASDADLLSYFPASALPVDATHRFADLFLTRSKWKADDISPFLADIAIDSKERDKLLLKYARATTDPQGIWYTARAQFNG